MGHNWVAYVHLPLFFRLLHVLLVSFEFDSIRSRPYGSSEETEYLLVPVLPAGNLNLQFICLCQLLIEPHQVSFLS